MSEELGTDVRGTASHFADWVFHKENPNYQHRDGVSTIQEKLYLGSIAHAFLDKLYRWKSKIPAAVGTSSNWKLLYSDPHDGSDTRTFTASSLIVDGKPMRCKPDCVLLDQSTGIVVIVERKVTSRKPYQIPKTAWPNTRAQLWCYAHVDEWMSAPDVLLLAQFYQRRIDFEVMRQDSGNPWRLLDIRPGWRRSNEEFYSESRSHFVSYGGSFVDERQE